MSEFVCENLNLSFLYSHNNKKRILFNCRKKREHFIKFIGAPNANLTHIYNNIDLNESLVVVIQSND